MRDMPVYEREKKWCCVNKVTHPMQDLKRSMGLSLPLVKFMTRACGKCHKISYEKTMNVRFCLSCDCFKQSFLALKVELGH